MDTLDTTKNYDYDSTLASVGIKCKAVYTGSIEFKTLVDEKFSGHEQRRDEWSVPRRGWVLEFEKTPATARQLESFFIRCKGKKKAFQWTWPGRMDGFDFGGDDQLYLVRFDTDKLEFDALEMGYKTFKVPIIQVMAWE
jgi:phage-related protein